MKKLLTLLFLTCGLTTGLWASSIPGALSGRFTINASGEKVLFSQGNLQYQASTNTWRFATNQYDYIGSANSNISDSYTGWIDLFGWGTGNNPTLSSWTYTDYSTFVDWGTNTISNGGNTANEWFSLSVEEWTYIFNTRDNACNLRGHSTVNGVNGYVILPDGFIIPDGLSFTPVTEWGSNVYNEQQWAQMETAGAVFFPASGCRASGKTIGSVGDYGGYYSCSNVNDNNVYNMSFGTSWAGPDGVDTRCYGRSVRLVRSSLQQDAEGYYLLGSADDWKDFAAIVNSGTNAAANAKMTADIDLGDDQTKIGSFSGIFDGQGHTITINLSTTEQYVGLFCNITDATINNLHVTGAITTNTRFVGGMVGRVYGTSTIQNCWSSVDVTTTYGGDGVQGGMVGCVNGTLNISDCLYNGALNGSSAYTWGGFVGWLYGTTNISNCLFASDEINVGASYTATHVAGGGTVTNCYYKNVMGSAQGTQASTAQLADGTTAYKLQNNRGDMVWGQRIGTDAMPVLTNDENYRVYRSKTGGYTNNPEEAYEGIQQDGEGNYLLGCLSDWQVFAEIVNSGTNAAANAKMTADINLGDDQTHIGSVTEGATPYYAGVFDGQGHTLTVNYVGESNQIVAPFTQISSATIKNLHVAGSIQSSYAYIGVVGMAGSGSVISKVWMSATMNTTQDGWVQSAAIAGYCDGSIQDCLFTGTYTSNGGGYMGGFYGYTNASPTITNCLSTGTFSQGNWQGNGVHTNCYLKQYPTGLTEGCSWATDETLSNGTTTTALQAGRSETVWVQDPLTNQPMLAVFAGKYTVPASGLGTFSAKAAFTLPEGLEAYYCKNYDASAGTIAVIAIDGVVPAETGVLLKGTAGETYTLTISDETAATVTDNALVAVTEQTTIQQTDGDYTNFGLSGGTFKKVNTAGGTVGANHAYLHIPTSALTTDASARGIYLAWDDDATGITAVNGSGLTVNSCYDLQGRRTENPSKGLYIVNGKKVIIK